MRFTEIDRIVGCVMAEKGILLCEHNPEEKFDVYENSWGNWMLAEENGATITAIDGRYIENLEDLDDPETLFEKISVFVDETFLGNRYRPSKALNFKPWRTS